MSTKINMLGRKEVVEKLRYLCESGGIYDLIDGATEGLNFVDPVLSKQAYKLLQFFPVAFSQI